MFYPTHHVDVDGRVQCRLKVNHDDVEMATDPAREGGREGGGE